MLSGQNVECVSRWREIPHSRHSVLNSRRRVLIEMFCKAFGLLFCGLPLSLPLSSGRMENYFAKSHCAGIQYIWAKQILYRTFHHSIPIYASQIMLLGNGNHFTSCCVRNIFFGFITKSIKNSKSISGSCPSSSIPSGRNRGKHCRLWFHRLALSHHEMV